MCLISLCLYIIYLYSPLLNLILYKHNSKKKWVLHFDSSAYLLHCQGVFHWESLFWEWRDGFWHGVWNARGILWSYFTYLLPWMKFWVWIGFRIVLNWTEWNKMNKCICVKDRPFLNATLLLWLYRLNRLTVISNLFFLLHQLKLTTKFVT